MYSTNSMTNTPDDLRSMGHSGVIRRPVVAKHQPRLTDPEGRATGRVRTWTRKVPQIGVRTVGTDAA